MTTLICALFAHATAIATVRLARICAGAGLVLSRAAGILAELCGSIAARGRKLSARSSRRARRGTIEAALAGAEVRSAWLGLETAGRKSALDALRWCGEAGRGGWVALRKAPRTVSRQAWALCRAAGGILPAVRILWAGGVLSAVRIPSARRILSVGRMAVRGALGTRWWIRGHSRSAERQLQTDGASRVLLVAVGSLLLLGMGSVSGASGDNEGFDFDRRESVRGVFQPAVVDAEPAAEDAGESGLGEVEEAGSAAAVYVPTPERRVGSGATFSSRSLLDRQLGYHRVRRAANRYRAPVERLLAMHGIDRLGGLYLRGFKREQVLEVWARPHGELEYRKLRTYPVCAISGRPGPKRREGDGQVPEGFYHVDRFNPVSSFRLSLHIDYPNRSDRMRSRGRNVGGQIFIHGGCVSVGCLAITDEAIDELYWLALLAADEGQTRIPTHIYPTRMDEEGLRWLRAVSAPAYTHWDFWMSLRPAYDAFERTRHVPAHHIGDDGLYVIDENRGPTGAEGVLRGGGRLLGVAVGAGGAGQAAGGADAAAAENAAAFQDPLADGAALLLGAADSATGLQAGDSAAVVQAADSAGVVGAAADSAAAAQDNKRPMTGVSKADATP